MNEQLQKALADLLNKANNGIDAAGNFLEAELPEVISQLLMWQVVNNSIFLFGNILLLIVVFKAYKWIKNDFKQDRYVVPIFVLYGVLSVPFCVFLEAAFRQTANILQIWIAPKVWLLEYAARLAS